MRVILDIGSLWGNSLTSAMDAVSGAVEMGRKIPQADDVWVKFQLCFAKAGNKPLPAHYLPQLVAAGNKLGTSVSASIWSDEGLHAVAGSGAEWVKLAWSAPRRLLRLIPQRLAVVMTVRSGEITPKRRAGVLIPLSTLEVNDKPHYGAWPDGAMVPSSCHGPWPVIQQALAKHSTVEFHCNPLSINGYPDSAFAIRPGDMR